MLCSDGSDDLHGKGKQSIVETSGRLVQDRRGGAVAVLQALQEIWGCCGRVHRPEDFIPVAATVRPGDDILAPVAVGVKSTNADLILRLVTGRTHESRKDRALVDETRPGALQNVPVARPVRADEDVRHSVAVEVDGANAIPPPPPAAVAAAREPSTSIVERTIAPGKHYVEISPAASRRIVRTDDDVHFAIAIHVHHADQG